MHWLADENVSPFIVEKLRTAGHDVTFVTERFPSAPDDSIFALASRNRHLLLTHDLGFGDLLFRDAVAAGFGVVLFRLRLRAKPFQWSRLQAAVAEYGDDLNDRFTVIEDGGIRSRLLR